MRELITVVTLLAVVALVVCRAVQISPSIGSKLGTVLAMLAGIAPAAWVMAAREVPLKTVVGYGVFFAGSVLLKWIVTLGVLSKYVYPSLPPPMAGPVQGVVSSTCEMGFAFVAFSLVLPALSFWQVFGFGAGAAAVEVLILSSMENPHAGTPSVSLWRGNSPSFTKAPCG